VVQIYWTHVRPVRPPAAPLTVKVKKGECNVDLYSESSRTPLNALMNMHHTVLRADNTLFAYTRTHSQAAPPRIYA